MMKESGETMASGKDLEWIYITKYVLTRGVIHVQATTRGDWASVRLKGGGFETSFKLGKDAFLTWEDARLNAIKMVRNKRKSLVKQIEKLDAWVPEYHKDA